jgi:SAM-dependent methyltransferase
VIDYVVKPCLFCGGEDCIRELYPRNFRDEDLTPAVFSARRVTEHYHYRMVRCVNTGLVFSREILPESKLAELYAGSGITFQEYAHIIRKDYWRPLERHAAGMTLGTALEIGCSSGFFLEELKSRGFKDVRGCEPSVEAQELAHPSVRDGIHTGFFTESTFPDATFDLICCFQTLDHLSDPLGILRTCHAKLKPGGLLYVIVHDADGLQARLFGEKSPIIDVEHVYLFNRRTLPLAVEKAGFTKAPAFPIRNSYPLSYWAEHAPIPFKGSVLSLLKATGLGGLELAIPAGNIGIVARKG